MHELNNGLEREAILVRKYLNIIVTAVRVCLNPQRCKVELDSLPKITDDEPPAVAVVWIVAGITR